MIHKTTPRRVVLTKHCFDQFAVKYPRYKNIHRPSLIKALVAAAGNARESTTESIVVDSGFLEGEFCVKGMDHCVPIAFVYKHDLEDTDVFHIITVLTPGEILGNGSARKCSTTSAHIASTAARPLSSGTSRGPAGLARSSLEPMGTMGSISSHRSNP